MPIREPYFTQAKNIGHRLIEIESSNPGLVRMRANWDAFVISAMVDKLKALGFRKRFLQSSEQFLYDSVLSYQQAIEECLPYTVLTGPQNREGHNHCWAGFGRYVGSCSVFALDSLFQRKTGDLDGVVLIVNIEPFFEQISDLLDAIPEQA